MKILRLKNSVLEVYSLKISLVKWPLQIYAQSIFFTGRQTDRQTDRHTYTHVYTQYIVQWERGKRGPDPIL